MIRKIANIFQKQRDLTTGNISKTLIILSLPMIVGNFLQSFLNVVDMFWVGRLGHNYLAGVAISGAVLMMIFIVTIGIFLGTIALISRSIGAKEEEQANYIAAQSIIFSLFSSIIVTIIGFVYAPQILSLLGADPEVVLIGQSYFRVLALGMGAFFFLFTFMAILQGAGDTFTPNIVFGISTLLNIVLDPIFIFGIGVPAMGVAGAALATVLSEIVAVVIGLEVLLRGRSRIHLKWKHFKINFGYIWRIIKIGIPASAQMSVRSIMMVLLMSIVAGFGTYAVAAYGVGMRLSMLIMVPGFALANAAATMVGQNLGANKPDRSFASAWLAVFYYFIMMVFLAVLGYIFAPFLISAFNNNPEVISIGTTFIRINVFSLLFVPFALVLSRALGGAGDTFAPFIITLISLWLVVIPLAIILPRYFNLGITGVFIAPVIGSIIQAIITVFWFNLGHWKYKKV